MNQTNEPVVKPLWLVIDEQGYPIHCGSYKEGCNEHINDAINDYQLEEAVHWKVIEATPIDPNTVTITAAEYAKLKEDAERFRFLTDDHADKDTRDFINRIGENLSTKSYGNVCMNIDQAIAQKKAGE